MPLADTGLLSPGWAADDAAIAQAERTGRPLADLLAEAAAADGRQLDREVVTGLLDPLGYTGCAGPLADWVLARYRASAVG